MLHFDVDVKFEDINRYAKRCFCPMHLGDCFNRGAYSVVNKIGVGSTSTVWLARDNMYQPGSQQHPYRYVALKVLCADTRSSLHEATVLQLLQNARSTSPDYSEEFGTSIICILEHFSHSSPNGVHEVLVLPVTRPLQELRIDADYFAERSFMIARQLFGACALAHRNNFTHGHLPIENTRYVCDISDADLLKGEQSWLQAVVLWRYPDEATSLSVTKRFDATNFPFKSHEASFWDKIPADIEAGLPKYYASCEQWDPQVCIQDFGYAVHRDTMGLLPPKIRTPRCYVAPEYVFNTNKSHFRSLLTSSWRRRRYHDTRTARSDDFQQVDVWSLGCLLYELLMGSTFGSFVIFNQELHEQQLLLVDPNVPEDWKKSRAMTLAMEALGPNLQKESDAVRNQCVVMFGL